MIFDRSKKRYKAIAQVTALTMLFQVVYPTVSLAQSGGPTQVETQSVSGPSNMVDLFTGDFSYAVPLMTVDGYPLSLNYSANSSMSAEASWVGYNWSLNPGAINREMRGLPDDFDGDDVTKTVSTKMEDNWGWNFGARASLRHKLKGGHFAGGFIEATWGPIHSNIRESGNDFSIAGGPTFQTQFSLFKAMGLGVDLNAGMKFNRNTYTGKSLNKNLGVGFDFFKVDENKDVLTRGGLGLSYGTMNSSRGGQTRTMSGSISGKNGMKDKDARDNFKFDYSVGGSSDISFGTRTYTPSLNISTYSINQSYGSDFSLILPYGPTTVAAPDGQHQAVAGVVYDNFSSENELFHEVITSDSYGYLNQENAAGRNDVLMDFNREKEGQVSENIPFLPMTNITYDIFRATGAGMGTSFRAYRNDVGTVQNQRNNQFGHSVSANVSAGVDPSTFPPKSWYLGARAGEGNQSSTSGGLNPQFGKINDLADKLSYKNVEGESGASPETENYYFQAIGETLPTDVGFYDQYGGSIPVQLDISEDGNEITAEGTQLVPYIGEVAQPTIQLPNSNYNLTKQRRNTLIANLNAEQATDYGFSQMIHDYSEYTGNDGAYTVTSNSRETASKKAHHLSEIDITQTGGARYVYGVPVYNLKEKQVMFNVDESATSCTDGIVGYTAGSDNTINNNKGKYNLYTATEVPAYAHTFLLSALLSSDYSDRTNNGLSEDDFGSYTKFNYSQIYGESDPFMWRSTQDANKALYSEGHKTYDDDATASYVYGEKELWYVHSIEGKTQVAEFYLSDRKDMYSLLGENGGIDNTKPAKKLDKIVLYNKEDREKNGANAEPLQTVHFEYDYSLCQNFPGNAGDQNLSSSESANQGGKLTLKKVWFTYSESEKGRLSPYKFNYSTENPDYNLTAVDRWGTYKPNDCSGTGIPNYDHPYTEQNKALADLRAESWLLKTIELPSGGVIGVEYEADDYGYVQDQKAMEMFEIIGTGVYDEVAQTVSSNTGDNHFRPDNDNKNPNDVLFVQLPSSAGANLADAELAFDQKYMKEIMDEHHGQLYVKTKVDIKGGAYEIIPAFVTVKKYGIVNAGSFDQAWIQLETKGIFDDNSEDEMNGDGFKVHPIQREAFQYVKNIVPRNIFPEVGIGDVERVNGKMYRVMNRHDYCATFDLDESFVRLTTPEGKKLGGDHRVKSIMVSDNWGGMESTGSTFKYGQTYEYTNGVATYEPMTGKEENPLYQPVEYRNRFNKFPDDYLYMTMPLGETFYDAPKVGYETVKVAGMEHTNVTRNATGYSVYEFNTCKTPEYSTKVNFTPLSKGKELVGYDFSLSTIGQALIGLPQYKLLGLTQGYTVLKNDMHGKPKSIKSFDQFDSELSSTEYYYSQINPHINTWNETGGVEFKSMRRKMDIVSDFNYTEIKRDSWNLGINIRMDKGLPLLVPTAGHSHLKEGYYSNVITKTIHDYAVLDKVITRHLGSEVKAQNLVWDQNTGSVLASSSSNEYNEPVYGISYPAYWYYKGMGHASDTYNNKLRGIDIVNGAISCNTYGITAIDYFYPGDKVVYYINGTGAWEEAWILNIDQATNTINLIDRNGQHIASESNTNLRVIQSGKKNMIGANMASVTQLDSPLGTSITHSNVLSASANTYGENWKMRCALAAGCDVLAPECGSEPGHQVNPYVKGLLGNWRPLEGFAYQIDRKENDINTTPEVDLRTGGTYDGFNAFYGYSGSDWVKIDNASHPTYTATDMDKWMRANTITEYDEVGTPLESKDVVDRYTGVLYGYNNGLRILPIASANNAKHTDLAFDGFEDYLYNDDIHINDRKYCKLPGHFDFVNQVLVGDISSEEAHSGRYSLKVDQYQNIATTRYIYELPTYTDGMASNQFNLQDCNCHSLFNPSEGKYLLSVWVKQNTAVPTTQYTDPYVTITLKNGGALFGTPFTFQVGVTEMIEGWQKIEGSFTIPSHLEVDCIEVKLGHSGSNTASVHFDDLRIHPFKSAMTTGVFDANTLRNWAQLDSYNYATKYEYNEEGAVVRVKQETINGIKTVGETRGSSHKKQ